MTINGSSPNQLQSVELRARKTVIGPAKKTGLKVIEKEAVKQTFFVKFDKPD